MPEPTYAERDADGRLLLRLKVVPGAKRLKVAGPYGDRLKVLVQAPPEDGKANRAVCRLIAAWTGVAAAQVELLSGNSTALKTLRLPAETRLPTDH